MVAIVSHDAGGAEILSAWVCFQSEPYCLVLDGPAKKIFEQKLGYVNNFSIEQAIQAADWVLCGTSWQSELEKRAVKLAKSRGKKVVSFIDHWVNYTERFMFEASMILPDEIWVGDPDAEKLAKDLFLDTKIQLQENPYFRELKIKLEKFNRFCENSNNGNILYVCEPIKEHALIQYGDERYWGYTEEDALTFFLKNISFLVSDIKEIRIRPHPSENPSKYQWCTLNTRLNIVFGGKKSLLEEIVMSDIIVGCESMAMVVGLLANKRVISSIPREGKVFGLPQVGIEHLRNLVNYQFKPELNA